MLAAPGAELFFSAANIWEIAIKSALGRLDFTYRADAIAAAARTSGLVEIPIVADTAARVAGLPLLHRDPFDRLLIAQAIDSGARLITADRQLPPYSDLVTLIQPALPRRA